MPMGREYSSSRSAPRLVDRCPHDPRRHIFGLRTDVRNGVHFVNQSVVAFVAGHNVVLHSLETRSQSFLPGAHCANCSVKPYYALARG